MSISEDRAKALEAALSQINKQFGAGSAMRLGDKPQMKIETTSTGSLAIDIALGVGGLPKGRIVEIYGPESSGKTLFCLEHIAEVQRKGGTAAFVDAEHALDPEWAAKVGVDVDNLIISQPSSGEQALEITEKLVRSGAVDVVVVDSVAALTPQKELDGDMGDAQMGLQARLMSQGLRKITAATNVTHTTVIFINQLREKIGVMFGSPETTTGGKALKFYASIRLDIRRIEQIKEGSDVIGNRTRIKVIKNKVAPPFKQAEFDIFFTKGNEGFSRESDILTVGVDKGVLKRAGAWYQLADGTQLGNGREKARIALKEDPELANKLDAAIRAIVFAKSEIVVVGDAVDAATSLDALEEED
jgi:recombination protein RecA